MIEEQEAAEFEDQEHAQRMISQRKREANRRNAQKARGPRSLNGKQRSRKNARKHGLSIPLSADRDLQRQLAQAIAGDGATSEVLEQALIVAEIELELQRIVQVRKAMLEQAVRETPADDHPDVSNDGHVSSAENAMSEACVRVLPTLSRIERYERRAYARRKKALARLEELRIMASIQVPGAGLASTGMPVHHMCNH